jgi:hypothetical protein
MVEGLENNVFNQSIPDMLMIKQINQIGWVRVANQFPNHPIVIQDMVSNSEFKMKQATVARLKFLHRLSCFEAPVLSLGGLDSL